MKKKWKKPELIVLVRGKPEEAVLEACKNGPNVGDGSNFSYSAPNGCADTTQPCPACSTFAGS